ncbi:MAG: extracellular solute-binding protein, partial [Ruthenibacterium sp.]
LDAQVKATFYNKKLFEENDVKVPTTKDEFFAACDKFSANGVMPMIHGYNNINCVFHELDAYFTSQAIAENAATTWVDSQSGAAKLEGNATVKSAFEQYSKMAGYKDPGDTSLDQPQAIQDFAAEKRPMFTNGGWIMGDVAAANPNGEFGMFPTPWSNNPEENKLWVGIDDVFIVSATTDKKELVLDLLNSFASDASSAIWMENAKLMSSNQNVSADGADPFIQEIKSYIDSGNIVAKSLVIDYTAEYTNAFRTQLQHFVTLDDADRDVDALIKGIDAEMDGIRG